MAGRDVGGGYLTEAAYRQKATAFRRLKIAANICINGPLKPSKRARIIHGPVVPGTGKCARCNAVAAERVIDKLAIAERLLSSFDL